MSGDARSNDAFCRGLRNMGLATTNEAARRIEALVAEVRRERAERERIQRDVLAALRGNKR